MDIRALNAQQKYAALKPATQPEVGGAKTEELAAGVVRDFTETLRESEELAKAAMTGDADPHALVQALAQTEAGGRNRGHCAQQSGRGLSGNPEDACLSYGHG